jgi:hypothetical protein
MGQTRHGGRAQREYDVQLHDLRQDRRATDGGPGRRSPLRVSKCDGRKAARQAMTAAATRKLKYLARSETSFDSALAG